jgi:hypothetical protein
MAVVDRLTPIATEKISVSIDSVSPTVAMAFAPSRVTQKTSTTANRDSIDISNTIGVGQKKNGPTD